MDSSLSRSINKIANIFGIEIHRHVPYLRAGSLRSMYDVCMQAKKCGLHVNTVFDVGVAEGTPELYEAFPKCEIVLVEPLREFNESIANILQKYRGVHINAAAGDYDGKSIINISHNHLDGTTLLSSGEEAKNNLEKREIDIIRLDSIIDINNLSGPFVIKADVQGAELKVIEGARGILEQTEMIILETSFFEFLPGNPQFCDVISFMKENNFVVYDFIGGAIRPFDGALGQIDVAFVKEFGVLRKNHSYGSFK